MMPDGWRRRKVRDFGTRSKVVNVGGAQLPPLSITKGRGVILQSEKYKKQIATNLSKYVIARRGQFAFDPMSLYYGAIGKVAEEIGLVSPDYVVFDVDGSVDKNFMNYLFRWPEQIGLYEAVAETGNQFGKRRRVYWSVFQDLEFALPRIEEQSRISAILAAADESAEGTQAVIAQLRLLKNAMVAELLARGVPRRHDRFKQTEIGAMPEEWSVAALGRLVVPEAPIRYGVVQPGTEDSGDVPFIRSGDVAARHLVRETLRTITHEVSKAYSKTVLRGGELLMALVGNPGATVLVPPRLSGANIARQVGMIRLSEGVDPTFVQCYLSSELGRSALLREAVGSAQQVINIRDLEKLPIPVPELDEQREIAGILASFDCRINGLFRLSGGKIAAHASMA